MVLNEPEAAMDGRVILAWLGPDRARAARLMPIRGEATLARQQPDSAFVPQTGSRRLTLLRRIHPGGSFIWERSPLNLPDYTAFSPLSKGRLTRCTVPGQYRTVGNDSHA
jgi:hypothetical protein